MASLLALKEYAGLGSSDEEDTDMEKHLEESTQHLKPPPSSTDVSINLAPQVTHKRSLPTSVKIDPVTKELVYNPKYDELFSADMGPEHPYKTQQQKATKNMLSGYVEPTNVNAFQFENQRRTFDTYGYGTDPSVSDQPAKTIGDTQAAAMTDGLTFFEKAPKRNKRKRMGNDDPSDTENYTGTPWSKYEGDGPIEQSEQLRAELDELLARQKLKKNRFKNANEDQIDDGGEASVMHLKEPLDYQGRNFLHPPLDVGVNLKSDFPPQKCFKPKRLIHEYTGHNKGVQTIRFFPKTAHLVLSAGMDSKVKIWQIYNERACVRTYMGHKQAVRDVNFNNDGTKFLSGSYDRTIKLWDTETGEVVSRYQCRAIPYCVKFHPDEQNHFVAGCQDKKVLCWDTRTNEVIQEYDRHLKAVNTVTFFDNNRRFMTTSDDNTARIWEWGIPVDFKLIADPSMHSMPYCTISPNGKWLAAQSMDNQIIIFNALNQMKLMKKKKFKGHIVAGYACQIDFSPEMTYLISGDANGNLVVWDFKTSKRVDQIKAHSRVCIGALWHPHETSKVVTCGWDGLVKLWD